MHKILMLFDVLAEVGLVNCLGLFSPILSPSTALCVIFSDIFGTWFSFSSYVISDLMNGNFLTFLKFSLLVHFVCFVVRGKNLWS